MDIKPVSLHIGSQADILRNAFKHEVKHRIYLYERRASGLDHVTDQDIRVKNVRIRANKAIADIEIYDVYGDRCDRIYNCEYPYTLIGKGTYDDDTTSV